MDLLFTQDKIIITEWTETRMLVIGTDDDTTLDAIIAAFNRKLYPDVAAYHRLLLSRTDWPTVDTPEGTFYVLGVAHNVTDPTITGRGVVAHLWHTIDSDGVMFYALFRLVAMAGLVAILPIVITTTSILGVDCDPQLVLPYTGGLAVKLVDKNGEVLNE